MRRKQAATAAGLGLVHVLLGQSIVFILVLLLAAWHDYRLLDDPEATEASQLEIFKVGADIGVMFCVDCLRLKLESSHVQCHADCLLCFFQRSMQRDSTWRLPLGLAFSSPGVGGRVGCAGYFLATSFVALSMLVSSSRRVTSQRMRWRRCTNCASARRETGSYWLVAQTAAAATCGQKQWFYAVAVGVASFAEFGHGVANAGDGGCTEVTLALHGSSQVRCRQDRLSAP